MCTSGLSRCMLLEKQLLLSLFLFRGLMAEEGLESDYQYDSATFSSDDDHDELEAIFHKKKKDTPPALKRKCTAPPKSGGLGGKKFYSE